MTDFKKAVKVAAAKKNMLLQDVAAHLEMDSPGFSRMINGNPTKDSIEKIAGVVGLKASELMALGEE